MLNLIFVFIMIGLFAIFSLIALPILWIIGKINKHAKDVIALRIVQYGLRITLFFCGVRTKIIGMENIPKDEPVLFVGNHNSILDILIPYCRMPNLTGFVAKNELTKIKGLVIWMNLLYCVFIDRNDIKASLKSILTCIDHVEHGISIAIFPEGTRSKDGQMLPFKEGSFKIATKTGCKIVPFVQNNTRSVFEAQYPKVKAAKTILEFMPPIEVDKLDPETRKHLANYVRDMMQETYNKNQALIK